MVDRAVKCRTQPLCTTKKTRKRTPYTTVDEGYRSMICVSKGLIEERPITEVTCPLLIAGCGRSALREKFISVKYLLLVSLVQGS